jgi:hypothetical protein
MFTIEYDNDTGPTDEGFWEWWTISDGKRSFRCDSSEQDAQWLCNILNKKDAAWKILADDGLELKAIQSYMRATGCGLQEAHRAVVEYMTRQGE